MNLVPNASPGFPLELTAEYAEETDALEMRLRWTGPEYNPLAQGDELMDTTNAMDIVTPLDTTGYDSDTTPVCLPGSMGSTG